MCDVLVVERKIGVRKLAEQSEAKKILRIVWDSLIRCPEPSAPCSLNYFPFLPAPWSFWPHAPSSLYFWTPFSQLPKTPFRVSLYWSASWPNTTVLDSQHVWWWNWNSWQKAWGGVVATSVYNEIWDMTKNSFGLFQWNHSIWFCWLHQFLTPVWRVN